MQIHVAPDVIARMGDKVAARQAAASLGIPVVPGSKEGFTSAARAKTRADEIGYDPKDRVVMVGNPGEADLKPYHPPFASFISAGPEVQVLGKIVFSKADGFAFNATGLEQPLWDPTPGRFLVPVQGEEEGLLAVIKVDASAKKFSIDEASA